MQKLFLVVLFIASCFVFTSIQKEAHSEEMGSEMGCLVEAIYFEARSESFIGQLAVAQVILNRVRHKKFPDTICNVVRDGVYRNGKPVKHKCSFSYWCDGKSERIRNPEAYEKAITVAHLALEGVTVSMLHKALYYHTDYVKPKWAKRKKFVSRIGSHLFYNAY